MAAREGETAVDDALRLLLQTATGRQTIVNKEAFSEFLQSLRTGPGNHRCSHCRGVAGQLRSTVQPDGGDAVSAIAEHQSGSDAESANTCICRLSANATRKSRARRNGRRSAMSATSMSWCSGNVMNARRTEPQRC